MATPSPSPAYLAQTRGPQILVGSILPAAVATVFVLARFYARAIIVRIWGWDDTWILLSWIMGGVILTVLNCVLVDHGAGKHMIAIPFADAGKLVLIGFVCRILYQTTVTTTKLAICALYLRIFQDRISKIVVWSMVAYNALFAVPVILSLIFRCKPLSGNWSIDPTAVCQNEIPPLCASVILNVIGDIALLVFVIPKIFHLQITPRQKNSLIAVLCLSILVIIAALARLVRLLSVINDPDVSFASFDVTIWSSVEINVSLFCAAAPAIRPLLKQVAPGFLSTMAETTTRTGRGGTYESRNNGIQISRKTHRGDSLELSSSSSRSQVDMDADYNFVKVEGGEMDSGSERGVLPLAAPNGRYNIRRTVNITVENEYVRDLEGQKKVKKFEHF